MSSEHDDDEPLSDYSLDEETKLLLFNSRLKDPKNDIEVNNLEQDQNKKKSKKKTKIKNIIQLDTKLITKRSFNPRLPPFNLIDKPSKPLAKFTNSDFPELVII